MTTTRTYTFDIKYAQNDSSYSHRLAIRQGIPSPGFPDILDLIGHLAVITRNPNSADPVGTRLVDPPPPSGTLRAQLINVQYMNAVKSSPRDSLPGAGWDNNLERQCDAYEEWRRHRIPGTHFKAPAARRRAGPLQEWEEHAEEAQERYESLRDFAFEYAALIGCAEFKAAAPRAAKMVRVEDMWVTPRLRKREVSKWMIGELVRELMKTGWLAARDIVVLWMGMEPGVSRDSIVGAGFMDRMREIYREKTPLELRAFERLACYFVCRRPGDRLTKVP